MWSWAAKARNTDPRTTPGQASPAVPPQSAGLPASRRPLCQGEVTKHQWIGSAWGSGQRLTTRLSVNVRVSQQSPSSANQNTPLTGRDPATTDAATNHAPVRAPADHHLRRRRYEPGQAPPSAPTGSTSCLHPGQLGKALTTPFCPGTASRTRLATFNSSRREFELVETQDTPPQQDGDGSLPPPPGSIRAERFYGKHRSGDAGFAAQNTSA